MKFGSEGLPLFVSYGNTVDLKPKLRILLVQGHEVLREGLEILLEKPGDFSVIGREREVLTRIALSNSNKAIARELGVSPKTVEKHRSNLMLKLQLHNAAAITMYANRNGMTSHDSFGFTGGLARLAAGAN